VTYKTNVTTKITRCNRKRRDSIIGNLQHISVKHAAYWTAGTWLQLSSEAMENMLEKTVENWS
jgi:hypothetical protein